MQTREESSAKPAAPDALGFETAPAPVSYCSRRPSSTAKPEGPKNEVPAHHGAREETSTPSTWTSTRQQAGPGRGVPGVENKGGRFTPGLPLRPADDLEAARKNRAPMVELTFNWDPENYDRRPGRNFGHLAYEVDDSSSPSAKRLADGGVTGHQPPAPRWPHGFCPLAGQHLDRAAAKGRPPRSPPSPGRRCRTSGAGRPRIAQLAPDQGE